MIFLVIVSKIQFRFGMDVASLRNDVYLHNQKDTYSEMLVKIINNISLITFITIRKGIHKFRQL